MGFEISAVGNVQRPPVARGVLIHSTEQSQGQLNSPWQGREQIVPRQRLVELVVVVDLKLSVTILAGSEENCRHRKGSRTMDSEISFAKGMKNCMALHGSYADVTIIIC